MSETENIKNLQKPRYKRVLLKVSGEALMGKSSFGHDIKTLNVICEEIKSVHNMGYQVCLVVGGGNIFRGISGAAAGMDRASADYMGMLATVINAIALQNTLEQQEVFTRVLSAIPMQSVCETYIRRKAVRHMQKGRVVIFAAGTGNPFFTTDTAAALRAVEMGCDLLLKGTQVDGVYDKDPNKFDDAKRFENLSYQKVLADDLRVMDASAISLARDNKIPIGVFNLMDKNGFSDVVQGKGKFTIIS